MSFYPRIHRDIFGDVFNLVIFDDDNRTVVTYSATKVEPGELAPPHARLALNDDGMRRLMDELWAAGVRPAHIVDEASRGNAQQRHIEDLRAIALPAVAALTELATRSRK